MKLIGLTGGIGTGKSTVSKMLLSRGIPVIDADLLARDVVDSGTFGLKAIVEYFGKKILTGVTLDRKELARIIFDDEEARLLLERITHPLIQWRALQEQAFYNKQRAPLVFYDASLIFEKGLVKNFDSVVVVHCTEENQVKRLVKRDSLTFEEIKKRISSQMSLVTKMNLGNHLIDNNGAIEMTNHQLSILLDKLKTVGQS